MRISAPVRAAAQRLTLPTLVFAAGMLTVLGKADILLIDRLRGVVADAAAPVLQLLAEPMAGAAGIVDKVTDIVAVYRQNELLRVENRRLLQWQEVALRLAAENKSLRDLEKLVPDKAVSILAARVIADSGGAYLRNVLVNAGARDGVARGQAALTGEGLVGRIAEVGQRTARVLLLTDLNSHIPVTIERTGQRALLDGDNSDRPRLVFLEPKAAVVAGDRILTSGSGGAFPPGLPVGVALAATNGVSRVEPYAELSRLEMVRIVDYGMTGVLPQNAVPPSRPPRPAKPRVADVQQ
ncbi:MAG TPA: rod shape-determining protein MreC [Stellaceae bacterium]|nr:rod shape-determining protein MreC [Stellaceae bacterium]